MRTHIISILVATIIPTMAFAGTEEFHLNCKVDEAGQRYEVRIDHEPDVDPFGRLTVTIDTGSNASLAENLRTNLVKRGIEVAGGGLDKRYRAIFPITNQSISFSKSPLKLEITFIRAEFELYDRENNFLTRFIKYPPLLIGMENYSEAPGYDVIFELGELPGNDLVPGHALFNFVQHCSLQGGSI